MNRRNIIIAALLVPLALFVFAVMSLDEPEYSVLAQSDGYELREYKPFLVAETVVEGSFDEAGSQAFRLLVGYIQGGNMGGRNLPMTAPVNQQPATPDDSPENTASAARVSRGAILPTPVAQDAVGAGEVWRFQFVMPKEYLLSMLPEPADDRVSLRRMPARLVAARRYSGGWGEREYRANEQSLLAALQRDGLRAIGAPVFARYNAPFVPGFMRRNEVLLEVERS